MRARSELLTGKSQGPTKAKGARGKPAVVTRLPPAERRAKILDRATDFFAEYGLTAQTRALAAACGVAQRLLYRYFPSKSQLLDEVYQEAIVAPFKAVWMIQLKDRSRPLDQRLIDFYQNYSSTVLTRKWLRLVLYASLAEARMAPDYNAAIVHQLMETIVVEAADAQGIELPRDQRLIHELGWALHGAISHFAIRRHVYGASQEVFPEAIVALYVRQFIAGFSAMAAEARVVEAGAASRRRASKSSVYDLREG